MSTAKYLMLCLFYCTILLSPGQAASFRENRDADPNFPGKESISGKTQSTTLTKLKPSPAPSKGGRNAKRQASSQDNDTTTESDLNIGGDLIMEQSLKIQEEDDAAPREMSEPIYKAGDLNFPCAPPGISDPINYTSWTSLQKLQFGVCFETSMGLIELIKNRTLQIQPESTCDMGGPTWAHIRPGGLNDIDHFDEFHEEVPVPDEIITNNQTKFLNARVVNNIGFEYIYNLMTSGEPVCDVLRDDQLPLECDVGRCVCKNIVPNKANDFTVHYSAFTDPRKKTIEIEYNNHFHSCTFKESGECTVQPNEKHGYKINCSDDKQQCLIKGNDVLCTQPNMTKTIELYNEFANKIHNTLEPFRMYYPIDCICTDRNHSNVMPKYGFELDVYVEYFSLLEDDYDRFIEAEYDNQGHMVTKFNFATMIIVMLAHFLLRM